MTSQLEWPDYLILAAFLAIPLGIGVYHSLTGGRQKTTDEFIMANRRLRVVPMAISLLVSFQSATGMLGISAEIYLYGSQILLCLPLASAVALVIIERIFVPWLYPLRLTSIYDYLELRYMSKSLRIYGASLGIIAAVLTMGVNMFAPSAALEATTGLPLVVSIPVLAAVSIAYTALGGMRAVIWTDVFQFVMMVIGTSAIFIQGVFSVGGISNVFHLAEEEGRLEFANFSPDPRVRHTFWNLMCGRMTAVITQYAFSQAGVQRFSAVDSLPKARLAFLLNIPPIVIMYAMYSVLGLIVLAYYSSIKCDPIKNRDITNPNQLLPFFVVTIFANWPGMSGVYLSSLYGGSLSTISSLLSGAAANCWEDILKFRLSDLSEKNKAMINRILVVFFGVVSTGVAFLVAKFKGPVTQVSVAFAASVAGPLLGLFLLGALTKYANWKGMFVGVTVGLALNLWLAIGSMTVPDVHPTLPPVSMERCPVSSGNSTRTLPPGNHTSFQYFEDNGADLWNVTGAFHEDHRNSASFKQELKGIVNFYAISYMWFAILGAAITMLSGILASLYMRDKDLEGDVDPMLLLRIRTCGWREPDVENDDEKCAEDLYDHILNEGEMKFLRKSESIDLGKTGDGLRETVC